MQSVMNSSSYKVVGGSPSRVVAMAKDAKVDYEYCDMQFSNYSS